MVRSTLREKREARRAKRARHGQASRPGRREQTIVVRGVGPVTFRPLGKIGMQRLQDAARRGGVRGNEVEEWLLRHFPRRKVQRLREDSLLISWCVVSPRYRDEDFKRRFEGNTEPLDALVRVIRERSWPNR